MKTIILFTSIFIIGCGSSEPVKNCDNVVGFDNDKACTLYDKVDGFTVKRASFYSEMIGGTAGEKESYRQSSDGQREARGYGAFYNCIGYSVNRSTAWCECPRGSDREFEDSVEKNMSVKWINK